MKIIWSLFDSETAMTQELNSDKYKVYSIGLPSDSSITHNFIKINLSKKSCIKKLEKLPKPNIIFASPPCETWVRVNIGNVIHYDRNHNEYNLYWQKNFKPNNYAVKHRELRLNGQRTAYWAAKIIKHFNPEFWCIENGASSLIFRYLYKYHNLKGYRNRTEYSSYDISFPLKPTIIYSNYLMVLANKGIKTELTISRKGKRYKSLTNYCDRSRVPIELYKHLLDYYEGCGQLVLF